MRALLIGNFEESLLQRVREQVSGGVAISKVHTLEEAEYIVSENLSEVKLIAMHKNLLSEEKVIIPSGQFIERIKNMMYQGTILVVTDSFIHWRILKKLGATHWAQEWNIASLIIKILNEKKEDTCST